MEWVNVEDKLPDIFAGKFTVETSDERTFPCYFYSDKMSWIAFYGQKPTYWWDAKTHQPVFNVIRWKKYEKRLPVPVLQKSS